MSSSEGSKQLFVVGIGVSAGGLDALTKFVANLPHKSAGFSVIIAQHLSPVYKSHLVELLRKSSQWEIEQAKAGTKIRAKQVFIAPPGHDITVENSAIHLTRHVREIKSVPSVDKLFRSIAQSAMGCGIGVVLSGAGKDGTEGAEEIKKNNGYVLVQDPREARQNSMPRAVITSGYYDKILLAENMGQEIQHYISNYPVAEEKKESSKQLIIKILEKKTGTDFSRYKPATIDRRIKKRLEELELSSTDEYYDYLKEYPAEIDELFQTVLIGVTEFFRDQEAFESLKKSLSELIEKKKPGDHIRIWSVGCATGEEPYSIAILLDELLGDRAKEYTIQIFATDIDEYALSKGRKAYYSEEQMGSLSDEIRRKYFIQVSNGYEIKKHMRQKVLFSKHDVCVDPPFVRLDLVSCRNLLIYFEHELQKEIIPVFHYALSSGGGLMLGKSENISDMTDLFSRVEVEHKIFCRKEGIHNTLKYSKFRKIKAAEKYNKSPLRPEMSLEEIADETLVSTFEHPYIVLDENLEVMHIKGRLQPFVELAGGEVNANALKIIHPAFHMELRTLLAKAKKQDEIFKGAFIKFEREDRKVYVQLSIRSLLYAKNNNRFFMVIFEQFDQRLPLAFPSETAGVDEDWKTLRIMELEQELSATKEHLHTFTEELETSNAELQSLNGELQSANQELKSSNEELETSNEELQTANAELAYSNNKLEQKESELIRIKEDLEMSREKFHLSLDNSNVMLFHQDVQLRYHWIYNAFKKIPLEDIIGHTDLEIEEFSQEDALRLHQIKEEVLHTEQEIQIEIQIEKKWYDLKIKPSVKNGKVSGIHGIGIDVTDRKTAADIIDRNQSILSSIINQGTDNIIAVNKGYKIIAINESTREDYYNRLKLDLRLNDNLIEKLEVLPERQKIVREYYERVFKGEKVALDAFRTTSYDGTKEHYFEGILFPITNQLGEIIGGANINREITQKVQLERQIQDITKRSANLTGDEFFKDLTDQLSTIFRMRYVYVGVFQKDKKVLKSLAFRVNGVLAENFEYYLEDTPCALVTNNNKSYHMEKVQEKFPHDKKLQEWGAESYIGVPITSPHTEKSIGILVMMDEEPWKENAYTDYLLTLLSIRAGAELERISAEQKVKEKSEQLTKISSNVPGILYEFKQGVNGSVEFTYISKMCERFFEVTEEEVLKNEGDVIASLLHKEDVQKLINEQQRALAAQDFFRFEGRIFTRKTRQLKWIKINANSIQREQEEVLWYGFIDDITQIKETQAALNEAKNEAEKAARAKEDFLATMSHEIRTPLNAIIGLSSLLIKKNPRQDQLENFKALKFSSENLMNLINDILDYSKMEAGKVKLETSGYNIKNLLYSIRQAHSLYAKERNNKLVTKIGDKVPEVVKGDQVKLAQILNNLMSNANKFTQGGRIVLEVYQEKEDKDAVYLHFAVRDTGIGISQENLNKIFDKFTQADSSTVRHYGGTGLGLTITKALLEMQGSEIKVASKVGEGSVFSFTLKQEKAEIQPQSTLKANDNGKAKETLQNDIDLRILLVEDVAINRMVVQQYFEEWWNNSVADEATNGREAVALARKNHYDIILMDIRMPEMDGYAASEAIRKLGKYATTPIIALTADTIAEFNRDERAKYMNDIITKPFNPQDLYNKISKYASLKSNSLQKRSAKAEHKRDAKEDILSPDFEKAEEPFREMPDKIVKFYEMALRSLETYRENYLKALETNDHKLISASMHKAKVLIDMLGLEHFYEKMYGTRKKMEKGIGEQTIQKEAEDISKSIDRIMDDIRARLRACREDL
ncbi:PAS domain S-box-containing protein [Catalinimonas alkaloidigena]|uniref:CheR family methyltransferase n=1 Tax=Catalinimonas alkaloidigena TaxID=1075417 RepID=UPI00240661D1|nr:CheR family methyltransferase [Catalinimonas alkaloidigena]MDF9800201.1 PAS domain S-box-containing protein [Catalinimonas alkaloidigena]